MTTTTKYWIVASAVIVASGCLLLHFFAPYYIRGEEVTARVVDSDSGEPVADASVEVTAHATKPYLIHGGESRLIFSYSTRTDRDGRFTVPAWGPVAISRGWQYGHLGPSAGIEKDGYSTGAYGRYRQEGDPPSTTHAFGTIATDPEWKDRNIFLTRTGHHHRAPWDNEFYRQVYPDAPHPGLTIKSPK